MSRKTIFAIIAVLVVIAAIIVGIRLAQKPAEENVIKIGAILPLTGSAAEIAEQHKMGLDFAVEKINSMGGINGEKLEIIYEDDRNDAKQTVSSFNKLVDIDKVPLVITAMSGPSMAIYPIAEQKKVVLFANCGHPEITSLGAWVFRNFPTSKHEAQEMIDFAYNKLKVKNLAILYVNDAFGEAAMKTVKDGFENLGGRIIIAEPFEKDVTDFRTQITKVIRIKPEAIYIYGYGKANGLVVKQTRELGYKGYILGSYNFSVEPTLGIAKDALEGSFFTVPAFDPSSQDKEIVEFVNDFQKKYDRQPVWNTVNEYDAINIIAEVIKEQGYSAEKIKTGLENLGSFVGLAGKYKSLPNGEWVSELTVKTFNQGRIVLVE